MWTSAILWAQLTLNGNGKSYRLQKLCPTYIINQFYRWNLTKLDFSIIYISDKYFLQFLTNCYFYIYYTIIINTLVKLILINALIVY
jgi:hypothetical protein